MDLTPETLRSIEFRRKGRGYDADEVDEFRAKVEIGVGELQARLREATSKLDEAETRARDAEERARTSTEGDETIQRTLLLAQRTADAAVKEAEETASRKVAEAEAEAERLLGEARSHRERAIAEAEAEVREAIDLKRAELLDELTTLERARDALAGDVGALEGHLDGQRTRLRGVVDSLTQVLEHPDALAAAASPALSGVEVPQPTVSAELAAPPVVPAAAAVEPEPYPAAAAEPVEHDPWAPVAAEAEAGAGASIFESTPSAEPAAEEPTDWTTASEDAWADPVAVDEPTPGAGEDSWGDPAWGDAPPPPPPPPPPGLDDAEAWDDVPPPPPPPPPVEADAGAEGGDAATFGGLSGPAVPDLDQVSEEDNPWLAELSDEDGGSRRDRSRFGRRR